MIAIPAVDILDHRVVQLVGGVPGSELVTLPDPLSTAMGWLDKGAQRLHIVDLDAALGRGDNLDIICRIIDEAGVPVQVGGGIRDSATVARLMDAGAAGVIVGTRALRDPSWLRSMADAYPGRMILAMDVKGGDIQMRGWQESAPITVDEMFRAIGDMDLAAVLHTNVDVEGRAQGMDLAATLRFDAACPHRVIASGGISSIEDVRALDEAGVWASVIGVAIYTGKIDSKELWDHEGV